MVVRVRTGPEVEGGGVMKMEVGVWTGPEVNRGMVEVSVEGDVLEVDMVVE